MLIRHTPLSPSLDHTFFIKKDKEGNDGYQDNGYQVCHTEKVSVYISHHHSSTPFFLKKEKKEWVMVVKGYIHASSY